MKRPPIKYKTGGTLKLVPHHIYNYHKHSGFWIEKSSIIDVTISKIVPKKHKFMGSELGFFEGSDGFIVWFWWMNLGSEGFEVQFFQIWHGFSLFMAEHVRI